MKGIKDRICPALSLFFGCLALLLISGCSIHRTYCQLQGDTWQKPLAVRLSPDNTDSYVSANMRAKSFVVESQGTLESVQGSYRYGRGDSAPVHPLEVASVKEHSAVLIPSASLKDFTNSYPRVQGMKEGRYVLDVKYRMDGRDYDYHGTLTYKRKSDWGVQVMGWR